MIEDALVMLAQEPWCMTPEQINKLTDWQIENLYAKPAQERSEKMRSELGEPTGARPVASSSPPSRTPDPGTPEHRRQMIDAFVNGPFRMKPEQAEKLYEKQLATWKAQEGVK